ncbi:hypothetical protein K439DRAFT_187783 [Ramaria rubella]|nr:hypothetical protein K439DRAFT_187783 [Ramaria rubella]
MSRHTQCRYIGVWLLNILSPLLYISLGAVLAFPEVWTFGVAESLPDHTRVSYGFLSCPISEEPVQSLSNYLSQFVEIIGGRVEDAQLALAGRKTELAIQDLTALTGQES